MKIPKQRIEDEELTAKLEQMYEQHTLLDENINRDTIDRDDIRDYIKELATRLVNDRERVEICLDDKGKRGWDRQVKGKAGGGLDVGLLQASLGKTVFNSLVCDRVTQHVFSQDKLELAVRTGKITEEQITECTVDAGTTLACRRV